MSEAGAEQPLLSHLLELRSHLIKAIAGFFLVFLPLAYFSKEIYAVISAPLMKLLPAGTSMIATEVASPFLTPLKLSAVLAFVLAMPWILFQIWAFVAPGLYKHERRLVLPLLASSTGLFYGGIAFAYFLVLPVVFHFFIAIAPEGVSVMTDINKYLDFVLGLFIAFGVVFETPVAIVLMVWAGFVTPATLAKRRDYVLVGVFVVAAVLTPPDIFSQVMLAVPAYLLFELGIIAARLMVPGSRQVEAQQREAN
jgi:sec-independent protein translocase protein TatC